MSERDVEILKRDVQKILNYLYNDEGTGKKGLVADVDKIKLDLYKFINDHKTSEEVKKAKYGLIGMIGGLIATGLLWLAEIILKHIHFL